MKNLEKYIYSSLCPDPNFVSEIDRLDWEEVEREVQESVQDEIDELITADVIEELRLLPVYFPCGGVIHQISTHSLMIESDFRESVNEDTVLRVSIRVRWPVANILWTVFEVNGELRRLGKYGLI